MDLLQRIAGSVLLLGLLAAILGFGFTDEIPLGTLQGQVVKAESQEPMRDIAVAVRPAFVITEQAFSVRRVRTQPDGTFRLAGLPVGVYEVEPLGTNWVGETQRIEVREDLPGEARIVMSPAPPRLELYASQRVYPTAEPPQVQVHGFGPDPTIALQIYTVDFAALVQAGGLAQLYWHQMTVPGDQPWDPDFNPESPVLTVYQTIEHELKNRDAEGAFDEYITLPPLPAGVYYCAASGFGRSRGAFLEVTDLGLITKQTDDELLAWTVQLDSGAPVAEAALYVQTGGAPKLLGRTDAAGLLRTTMPGERDGGQVGVFAEQGGSRALLGLWTGWSDEDRTAGEQTRTYLYTDRPIYRPGHEVLFKGLVRGMNREGYSLPRSRTVSVELRDPDDNIMERTELPLNGMGTFHGRFAVHSEAPTGLWGLLVRAGGTETRYDVEIAAYRKPEYAVRVGTPAYVVDGSRATITVGAEYFFGGAAPNAEVQAHLTRSPVWHDPFADPEDSYEWEWGGGEYLDSFTGRTDGDGNAVFTIPVRLPGADDVQDPWLEGQDYRYTFEASVADAGGKYYNAKGTFLVTRGEFALRVDTDQWIARPGDAVLVSLSGKRHDGGALENQQVTLTWGYEHWDEDQTTHRWVMRTEDLGSQIITLDAAGKGATRITIPRNGSVVLRASAQDAGRRTISARSWLYVADGSRLAGLRARSQLELQPDKSKYAPGETARLLCNTEASGVTALLTIEADRILASRLITLDGPGSIMELPVQEAWLPNVYVSLCFVHGREFVSAQRRLNVDVQSRVVQVEVRSNKEVYEPGESVEYTIRTFDQQQQPLTAEVSLGVVDEAIYALRTDRTDPVAGFYPRRWNQVSTNWSFAPVYLDGGDKGEIDTDIRSQFRDTAAWIPQISTGPQGVATVSVTLPDNLTQWRATAVAITGDTRVGMQTSQVTARKELMIRLQTPRVYTQRDTTRLTAVLHNATGAPVEVKVTASANGAALSGEAVQTLTVAPGTPVPVHWPLTVPTAGAAEFTVRAEAGPLRDAVRLTVPVVPRGRTVHANQAGEFLDTASFTMTIEPNAIRETGQLQLEFAPSPAHTLLQSLDYLIGYPYGCTEQTMSRFVPTILAADVMRRLGIHNTGLAAKIPDMAAKGYARLQRFQHGDGGWGWWEYDESDPWMTAYVLEGYARAAEAGYPPNAYSRDRGLQWARDYLAQSGTEEERVRYRGGGKLFLLRALALHNDAETVLNAIAAGVLDHLKSPAQLASGLLIADLAGDAGKAQHFVEMLEKAARTDAAGMVSWEEQWWGVETTAQVALALASARPNHPLLPGTLRYLAQQRRGNAWTSTRDTAIAVAAFSRYLRSAGIMDAEYTLTVQVNGAERGSFAIRGRDLAAKAPVLTLPVADLGAGTQTITLVKDHAPETPCFFSAHLTQVLDEETLAPRPLRTDALTITREYFPLQVRMDADGNPQLIPERDPAARFKPGALIRCRLTIEAKERMEFIQITDPLPAGIECVDRIEPEDPWSWRWWWSRTDLRDDHIAFFARWLPAGTSEITYLLRAEQPGVWQVLPAMAANMYAPEESATSAGAVLEVRP